MAYCPNCGGDNVRRKYSCNEKTYICYDCEIEFQYNITKYNIHDKENMKLKPSEWWEKTK